MANLEDHAIQRDRRFLVRLVVAVSIGAAFGLWAMEQLTADRTAAAGASMLGYPGAAGAVDAGARR